MDNDNEPEDLELEEEDEEQGDDDAEKKPAEKVSIEDQGVSALVDEFEAAGGLPSGAKKSAVAKVFKNLIKMARLQEDEESDED